MTRVVLLHAFPLDERMWEPQLAALADHEVVAPNLYSLGGGSIDGWAERVLADLDSDAVVVGASMGGYTALAMARREPQRIRALLLAGARPDADTPERRSARADTIRLIEEGGAEAIWEDQRDKLFAAKPPDSARDSVLARTNDELVRGVEALRDREDNTEALRSLEAPKVLAQGAGDLFFPLDEARAVADDAHARLVLFEHSKHLPSLEQPTDFNETLLELLRAQPKS